MGRMGDVTGRFIPTPVGNTLGQRTGSGDHSVHPHTRGEHAASHSHANKATGSSPHPWGTQHQTSTTALARRFIPTPRGEHATRGRGDRSGGGSSPHPWGTQHPGGLNYLLVRFIPTPVGNTRNAKTDTAPHPVHPHTRGEHGEGVWVGVESLGSSPHPWGTPVAQAGAHPGGRFIPTPVGNTSARRRPGNRGAVHPHTRGEHRRVRERRFFHTGSSPHPWGTPIIVKPRSNSRRFIPTPVGNTALQELAGGRVPVHPHTRGEH